MRFGRLFSITAIVVAFHALPGLARAEIVERELGTDANGDAVKGYVFQAGRSFGRPSSRSRSPVRRVSRSRWANRGIRTDYSYSHFYVPIGSFYWGAPSTFCRVPSHYFRSTSFSVRVVR